MRADPSDARERHGGSRGWADPAIKAAGLGALVIAFLLNAPLPVFGLLWAAMAATAGLRERHTRYGVSSRPWGVVVVCALFCVLVTFVVSGPAQNWLFEIGFAFGLVATFYALGERSVGSTIARLWKRRPRRDNGT